MIDDGVPRIASNPLKDAEKSPVLKSGERPLSASDKNAMRYYNAMRSPKTALYHSFRMGDNGMVPVTETAPAGLRSDVQHLPTGNPTAYTLSTLGGVPASPKSTNARP